MNTVNVPTKLPSNLSVYLGGTDDSLPVDWYPKSRWRNDLTSYITDCQTDRYEMKLEFYNSYHGLFPKETFSNNCEIKEPCGIHLYYIEGEKNLDLHLSEAVISSLNKGVYTIFCYDPGSLKGDDLVNVNKIADFIANNDGHVFQCVSMETLGLILIALKNKHNKK